MNATLQGLSTVRGFKAETILEKEFHDHQDHNTSAWFLFTYASRGFAFWLDLICLVYIAVVTYSFLVFSIGMDFLFDYVKVECSAYDTSTAIAIYLLIKHFIFIESQSGNVGLAILSSINLIGMCQWGMRQSAELENQMTSVERIMEYANVASEATLETDKDKLPPKGWPNSGDISFNSLSLRYVENTSRVLRNVTFSVHSKVKIY